MSELDNVALGQLVVEIKALQGQNHKDHGEIKAAMQKDREWAEGRFKDLFDKADNNNVRIAKNETNITHYHDAAQTMDIKMDRIEKVVPEMKANVDNLVWFNRIIVGGFVLQLIATILVKAWQ